MKSDARRVSESVCIAAEYVRHQDRSLELATLEGWGKYAVMAWAS
jgi:hypothetical protein